MNRNLHIFIIASALLAGISCGGRVNQTVSATTSDPSTKRALPIIELSEQNYNRRGSDTLDMGRIRSGETVVKPLLIRNTGETPVVITGLEKNCDCLDISYSRTPLKPGDEVTAELSFDSKRITGWVYKTIGIRTSLGVRPYVLVVTADVE